MAIPISIDRLLNENIVEWARIEFKESWNPDAVSPYHHGVCSFLFGICINETVQIHEEIQTLHERERWDFIGESL